VKINIYDTFSAAELDWREFEETGTCDVFQRYDWLSRWFKYIGKDEGFSPVLITVRNCIDEPLFMFPLAIQTLYGLRMLTWLGGKLTDYQAPLIGRAGEKISSDEFGSLWTEIKKKIDQFDLIYFVNQPENIGNVKNPFVLYSTRANAECFRANIDKSLPYFANSLSKKIQSDTRRQIGRLSLLGELKFVVAETTEERKDLTRKMIVQKQNKYLKTGVKNIFRSEKYKAFYEDMSTSFSQQEIVHISALYVGDVVTATHWGMIWRDRFYYLMPGHESGQWDKYSTGRILLKKLMQCLENREIKVFDFTIGSEKYKSQWANQKEYVYEQLEASSWRGTFFILTQKAYRFAKRRLKKFYYLM